MIIYHYYSSKGNEIESFCGQKRIFIIGRLGNRGDKILCSVFMIEASQFDHG